MLGNMTMAKSMTDGRISPKLGQDIDHYIGLRVRERRIMLGLSQQQLAELIGVTYQQEHKYEKGINRIAAGRLSGIARALGVDIGYFFDGINSEHSFKPTPQQRMLLELGRNFIALPREYQEAITTLARSLACSDPGDDPDLDTAMEDQATAA